MHRLLERRLTLLEKFSLLSFVSVVVFCAALGLVSNHFLTRNMLDQEWQGTAELVRYQVQAYGLERLFTDDALRADPERYRRSLSSLLNLPEVVKVKVWGRDGAVIWATDARIIGQRFPDNPELRASLAGRVSVQLKPLQKAEHRYEREEFATLAEVYAPIFAARRPGEVIGVLEVYKVPARLLATVRRVTLAVWGAVIVGGVLLYLSLFWIVRVASRSQRRLERSLEERSEQLRERNATLEFFLQSASHDLRGDAVAINAVAGRLLEAYGGALGDEGDGLLRRLQANVEHQDRLLADLLMLSRLGTKTSAPREVDVAALVREVVESVLAEQATGPVKVAIPAELPMLVAIPEDLRQVVGHLVANAVRFADGQPAPAIEVGGEARGQWVELWVRDNGIGIDPAYHAKIFELFQRLDGGAGGGTGVGLTVVKKIVEGVGGAVRVESELGRGATFRVTVPRQWPARAAVSG
jgi:signal transduction histidine kinase